MTYNNPSEDDIQSKAHQDELNKAEDRIEDRQDDKIEHDRRWRKPKGVPSPKEIANVTKE
jgi:hypothetical protein